MIFQIQMMAALANQNSDSLLENLKRAVADRVGTPERLQGLEQLGFFDSTPVVKKSTALDTVASYLNEKLKYQKNERDLVILRHDIGINWPNNTHVKNCFFARDKLWWKPALFLQEQREITLVVYGEPNGNTAMAKTVGYPAAISTKMLLEKEIQKTGMVVPLSKDIYKPVLQRLEQEGIRAVQRSKRSEL